MQNYSKIENMKLLDKYGGGKKKQRQLAILVL